MQTSSYAQISSELQIKTCTKKRSEHLIRLGYADQLATKNNLGFSTQLTVVKKIGQDGQLSLQGSKQLITINSAYGGSKQLRTVNSSYGGQNSSGRSKKEKQLRLTKGRTSQAQGRETTYAQKGKTTSDSLDCETHITETTYDSTAYEPSLQKQLTTQQLTNQDYRNSLQLNRTTPINVRTLALFLDSP
ncbi:hypothetical protein F511_20426 [Dorcoceras hygrometricum]|uniref:Uncharacterized protein n=1 Tax=Dorcoceras hygrometricum TaxID=472368 RepID=A0A2Z7DES0_9LAMI|nr:hypothetical protein F511_20426 [Dorcoceras hygrometricum]